ncbi:twin-arginine translocase subunit TatC [Halarchaeum salinum]|uniref:Sec-independent protein translocase protein TatC n=1 Tax=Halarchaeum salinum TaxID=489912 RepID=A0AAV3S5I0_9EURY
MGDASDGPSDDGLDGDDTDDIDAEDVTHAEDVDADPIEPAVTDVSGDDAPDTDPDGATTDADAEPTSTGAEEDDDDSSDAESADESAEPADESTEPAEMDAEPTGDGSDDEYADPPDSVPDTGDPSVPDEVPSVEDEGVPIEEHDGAADDVEPVPADEVDEGVLGEGPSSDEEQPIAVHVEEMVRRLGVVVLIAGVVSALCFPFGDTLITVIWDGVLPASSTAQPHIYAPLELIVTQFKVASIAGVIVALPVIVYETYAFMRPGLYPHERRYYLAAIPTSLVLAVVGVVFAYFVVVPSVMSYFLYYSTSVANAALALGSTFNLILVLMAYLAIVFQIPLFVMLAIMMGLTTRRWLADRRLLFWGAFAGVSFLATPDPTGVAPVVVAATMIVLFEGTLLLLRWTGN